MTMAGMESKGQLQVSGMRHACPSLSPMQTVVLVQSLDGVVYPETHPQLGAATTRRLIRLFA